MVYTRGQKSASITNAAQALLMLRGPATGLTFTRYSLASAATPATSATPATQAPSQKQLWTQWTNWYHAFVSEITDESPHLPIAERRSQATSRWVTYAAKQLHCSESHVRAWLRTADQKDLAAAYA